MGSTRVIVLKNISANALLQVITVIGGFILPPLIVTTYGSTINGMVASIKQFISYLTLVEAGVGAAGLVALYPALAKKDHPLRDRILASIHHFYRISGCLFAVGLLALAAFYSWMTRHQISPELTFWMVLVLGSVNVMDFFFFGTYRILMIADQRNYVLSLVYAAFVVVNVATAYFLIKAGHNILDVQIFATLFTACRFVFLSIYVRRTYGKLNLRYNRLQSYKLEQNWDVMVHMVGGLVVFSTPIVLVTLFLSLKDASIYAVYALVFTGVSQGIQMLTKGITSVFGHSLNTDKAKLLRQFRRFELLFFCVLGWVYTCTALLFMPFISIYTRNMHDADYHQPMLAALFVLSGLLMNIRIPAQMLIDAAGHYKETKWRSLCEAGLNLVSSIVFIQVFGLLGVLLGNVVSSLYRSNDMIVYSAYRVIQMSVKHTYILLILLSILILVCIRLWGALAIFNAHSYLEWILLAGKTSIFMAVPFLLMFWLGLTKIKSKGYF